MTESKPSRRRAKPRRTLSRRKRVAFTAIALALPFALLAIVEVVLRIVGYGGYPPTFQEIARLDDGAALIGTDPEGSRAFFFRNPTHKGTLTSTAFASPKPPDTVRIVLVGGSAIKGYPQIHAFAPSMFLERMLADAWPDRHVEVVNLGTTAIASFPVLVMATQMLEYEPDLVVAYSGHNEYFGAYGVASLNTVARSPGMIALQYALRRFALVQWIDRLLAGKPKAGEGGKMLMEIMMARPFTGPRDPLREAAANNLRTHLSAIARRCEHAGVPVILCTLPCNERGLSPLGTPRLDAVNPGDQKFVLELLEAVGDLPDAEIAERLADLREAVAAAPDHARLHWLLGRALHETGAHSEAAQHFALGVDLDPMPWRATSAQNDAIRDAATRTGATLCDVQAFFRQSSPGGSVGWELMDDHVHMSLRGQALVAEAIVRALATGDGPLALDPSFVDSMPGWEEYARRLGDNPFERYAVAYRMRRLFDVPFYRDTNREALAIMDARMREIETPMTTAELSLARQWQHPDVNRQFTRPISSLTGIQAMHEGRFEQAAQYFLAVLNAMPAYTTESVEYAYLHCRAAQRAAGGSLSPGDERIARSALERARVILEHSTAVDHALHRHAGTLLKVLGDHAGSIPHLLAARAGFADAGLVELDQTLIHSYLQVGELDRAAELAAWGQAHAGRFSGAYAAMARQVEVARTGGELPPDMSD